MKTLMLKNTQNRLELNGRRKNNNFIQKNKLFRKNALKFNFKLKIRNKKNHSELN